MLLQHIIVIQLEHLILLRPELPDIICIFTLSQYIRANFSRPLYNGIISSMTESIDKMTASGMFGGKTLLYNHKYNQLNRITGMDTYHIAKCIAFVKCSIFRWSSPNIENAMLAVVHYFVIKMFQLNIAKTIYTFSVPKFFKYFMEVC